jgi:hypothetical protein
MTSTCSGRINPQSAPWRWAIAGGVSATCGMLVVERARSVTVRLLCAYPTSLPSEHPRLRIAPSQRRSVFGLHWRGTRSPCAARRRPIRPRDINIPQDRDKLAKPHKPPRRYSNTLCTISNGVCPRWRAGDHGEIPLRIVSDLRRADSTLVAHAAATESAQCQWLNPWQGRGLALRLG